MKDNTPPRPEDDDDVEEIAEEVYLENDVPPEDEDELDMEELTLEEFESRLENSAGVMDDAIYTFGEHKEPVFACSFHPHSHLSATGGEDDKVFVWNRKTGEVVHKITEHTDTVTEVHFNHDGSYLASGDMAGGIIVHKVQEGGESSAKNEIYSLRKVWEYSMGDMSWLQWHKSASVLFAGSESGEIYVFRIPSGKCKILPGSGARCESGDLTNDGLKLLASYQDGEVKLWDIKSATVVMEIKDQHPLALQAGTLTVCCDKENPIYAVGDETGKIVLCTPSGPVGQVNADGSIECLAFSPSADFRVLASATLQGQVAVWDYSKLSKRIQCQEPISGVIKLEWISDFTILVSTLHGNIIGFDARTGSRKFTLSGHVNEVYSFSYDPRESLLLSVSEDHAAKIFKVPELGD